MTKPQLIGVGAYDSESAEELLERFNWYIVAQTEKIVFRSSDFAHPYVLDLEIDDIVQNVRIKFWKALCEKEIEHPWAFIRQMVHNEFIDALRRRKQDLPLPIDDDGEPRRGQVMVTPSEAMTDPAHQFEQKEAVTNCLTLIAEVVSIMPRRQQLAMLCSLQERVDDVVQLIDAFKGHQVDVESAQWPEDEVDAQRLKASLSAARQKIDLYLKVHSL